MNLKPKIYIETTIPSFYHETRQEPSMIARRDWTRDWWNNHRDQYSLLSSSAVLDELERGEFLTKTEAISLLNEIQLLPVTAEIQKIVETYVGHYLMPNDVLGDALHLALASFYNCNYLLTWNCSHLANAKKFEHIRYVNSMLGVHTPSIITPLELISN